MSYKFKVYIRNDKECFEYNTKTDNIFDNRETEKIEYNFTDTILDFIYFDIYKYEKNFETIKKILQKGSAELILNDDNLKIIEKNIREIGQLHPYFKFVEIDMIDRVSSFRTKYKNFQSSDEIVFYDEVIPHKKISHIPSNVQVLQNQILDLFQKVLDILFIGKSTQEKIIEYYQNALKDDYVVGVKKEFSFEPLLLNFEMVNHNTFTEVLYPKSIYDIVNYFVRECVIKDQIFKKCKNCGKYFNATKYKNTEYCDRIYKDNQTCKELGATNTYQQKINQNPIIKAYNKAYKTHFARIRIKKMTREEFSIWSEMARQKRGECEAGKISLEDFKNWLKKYSKNLI